MLEEVSSLNPGGYEEEEDEEEDEQDEDFYFQYPISGILSHVYPVCDVDEVLQAAIDLIQCSDSTTAANKPKVTVEMCLDKIVGYAQNLPLSQVFFSRFCYTDTIIGVFNNTCRFFSL